MKYKKKIIIGDCTLYLANCLDILPYVESEIDAVLSDPPYGINLDTGLRKRTSRNKLVKTDKAFKKIHGDDKPFNPKPFLKFPKVILWGGNHYHDKLPNSRAWIIWDKRENLGRDHNSDCEMAWTNLKGVTRIFYFLWKGMIRRGKSNIANENLVHPTQKPVELMQFCIERLNLKLGSVVFDGFGGSGPVPVACLKMGMKCIACEIDEDHFENMVKAVTAEYNQLKLI